MRTHGEFRATNDIDVICGLTSDTISKFLTEIRSKFIVDEIGLREHLRSPKAYNILHEETFLKIDLLLNLGEFEHSELQRASRILLPGLKVSICVASAEDMILSKLRWYRNGGKQSERHWSDVLGIVRVQREKLDYNYLSSWATKMGTADLLVRAIG